MGYKPLEILEIFKKYAKKIKYIDGKNFLKLIYGIIVKRKIIINGLNSGEIIEKLINEVGYKKNIKNIKDIKMPLLIPMVNVKNGKTYFFYSKENRVKPSNDIVYSTNINIGKAVRASCSYPLVFSPCKYKDIEFVDGGIRENIPWKGLRRLGADKIISVIFEKNLNDKCCDNIIEVVSNSLDIMAEELLNYELNGVDYLIKIKTKNISLLDTSKIEELYEIGYKTAKLKIKEIEKIVK